MKVKPKPSSFDILVGQNLRTIRKLKCESQSALANAVGVTFQQVQKYERGENRISATRLYLAAEFFDIDLISFFEGYKDAPKKPSKKGVNIFNFDNQTIDMIGLFTKIEDKELKKSFLRMLKKLSS